MTIDGIPGRYVFKALIKNGNGWKLTDEYFFDVPEVKRFTEGYEVIWPVEVQDGGVVYIPDASEMR